MIKKWVPVEISLKANQVYSHKISATSQANVILVNNTAASEVFLHDEPGVSGNNYDVRIPGKLTGALIRPFSLNTVYLVCAADVKISITEVQVDDPVFVYHMQSIGGAVVVSSTPALKASELDLDVNKALGVRITENWISQKVSGSGDVAVKATAGKVAAIKAVTAAVDVVLKDGTAEKWAALTAVEKDFIQPITCSTSIVLNFSAAGEAWIIYK